MRLQPICLKHKQLGVTILVPKDFKLLKDFTVSRSYGLRSNAAQEEKQLPSDGYKVDLLPRQMCTIDLTT